MKFPAFFSLFLLIPLSSLIFAEETPDWQQDADARIEKHRKTNVSITVTRGGVPVGDAKIHLKMTRHEFLFGANIFPISDHDLPPEVRTPEVVAAFKEKCEKLLNFATLSFYWWIYEKEKGEPKHEDREESARWCVESSIVAKGHPLAWGCEQCDWQKQLEPDEYHKMQLARIEDCVSRFRGLVTVWDVTNEVTQYDREDCLEKGPVGTESMRRLGPVNAVRDYFAAARKASPDATLLINDYYTGEEYANLLDELRDENGKPIFDVIGIQSHMHSGAWGNEQILEICDRFSRFGVPLHFTELTILSGEPGWFRADGWESAPEWEEKQAEEAARVYTMLFSHPSVAAVTWWDFSDLGAWMNAPSGLVRRDMSEKPAFVALHDLIKKKWWTDETLSPDSTGTVNTRVFRGTYEITITLPDGTREMFEQTVTGEKTDIQVEL